MLQARLPQDHPVCQGLANDVPQRLDALARVHKAVRAGRTAVVSEVLLGKEHTGPAGGELQPAVCLLCPSGTCASAAWIVDIPGTELTMSCGVSVTYQQGSPRCLAGSHALPLDELQSRALGWSASGAWFANIYRRANNVSVSATGRMDTVDAGSCSFRVQLLDVQARKWRPELQVAATEDLASELGSLRFAPDEAVAAVAVVCGDQRTEDALVVFSTQWPIAARISAERLDDFVWLPGTGSGRSLIVLASGLSRVELTPGLSLSISAGRLQPALAWHCCLARMQWLWCSAQHLRSCWC